MIESLYIAESGMSSQQKLIDVISNNIANSSTPGFKRTQLNFVDLVYQSGNVSNGAAVTDTTANAGAGVSIASQSKDFSVGDFQATENPFDLAIQGPGFLEVQTADGGLAYTRAGRLRLDEDGFLVTTQGHRLSANIQVPPDSQRFLVSPEGEVSVQLNPEESPIVLGNLELVRFNNDSAIQTIGRNLYAPSPESGNAVYGRPGELGLGQVVQGVTEVSNVSMTEEMVNLMLAQRGYQLNARIIQISDQILDTVNNLRR